jgi:5-carboxymethyl-2-hydroxymuconate isomerase
MAHFVLEYSDNLNQDDSTIQLLFGALHQAATDTGLFPLKGIRSRGYCCKQYRLADGNPNHGFAHLEVKLGAGRSMAERQAASDIFFSVFTEHFGNQIGSQGVALSFQMRELEPVLKFNKNNVQDYL